MKKHLILMALLLGLSIGGMAAAHTILLRSGEQITYLPTCITGDLASTDGLVIEQDLQLGRRISWHTRFEPSRGTESEMDFSLDTIPTIIHNPYTGLDFNLDWPYSFSSDTNIDLDIESRSMLPLWNQLYRLAADSTASGEVHTETIRLADYTGYFPSMAEASVPCLQDDGTPGSIRVYWPLSSCGEFPPYELSAQEKTLLALTDLFRYPVPEDFTMTITATRTESGELLELDVDAERSPQISSISTASEDWVYFIPVAHFSELSPNGTMNHPMDYSQTPNGFGIYRIPADLENFSANQLEFICPLEHDTVPSLFLLSQDGSQMLMVLDEGLQDVLYVLDADTGAVLQRLILWDHTSLLQDEVLLDQMLPEDRHDECLQQLQNGILPPELHRPWISLRVRDGYLLSMRSIFREHQEIQVLVPDGNGWYESHFTHSIPDAPDNNYFDIDDCSAWDGSRLALAAVPNYSGKDSCSFWLMVFDESGLLCSTEYVNSLDVGWKNAEYVELNAMPRAELRLHWDSH